MKKIIKLFCLVCVIALCLCCVSCSSVEKRNDITDDLYEFSFKFNGVTYTIPESIETFTDNGWVFPDSFDSCDDIITPGNLESTYLSQGDSWFNIEIFNNTDGDLALKDCPIGRVTYDFSEDIEVYTAGNFLLNDKTLDEVVEKYGEPLSQAEYGGYTEIIYDKTPDSGIYDRYTFRFDDETNTVEYIDIIYFY